MMSESRRTTSLSPELASAEYSSADVQAVLTKALELQATTRYSAQQLREMAADLDVPADVLVRAEQAWRSQQASADEQSTIVRQQRQHRRQQWQKYLLASVLMIGIDIATAGGLTWAIFPVAGWGLSLVLGWCDRSGTCRQHPAVQE